MPGNNPPAVVLVRPQMGENIGAVARAMANFGLTDLRLVAPRDGWPNQRAWEVSSGADHILDNASLHPDIASALTGIHLAFATTARSRDIEKRVVTPAQAMQEIQATDAKTALVFGPERTGLENDDFALCDAFISIPTTPDYFSLNLAQAVVILGYEWFARKVDAPNLARDLPEPAPKEDWAGLFDQLESYLDETDFFRVPEKKPVMWNNARNMLLRGQFTSQEIRTFRGILRVLWEGRKPRQK